MLRSLSPFLLATCLMAAPKIHSYRTELVTSADGSGKATISLALEGCAPGALLIPVGFASLEHLQLEAGPAGLRLEADGKRVRLLLPEGVPAACQVSFSFPVAEAFQPPPKPENGDKPLPKANRSFKANLVNTQETPIEDYQFDLRLPEGWMVQGVREQLPKLGKAEAGPRVRLGKVEGRQNALLKVAKLAQGDNASMTLETLPVRRSPLWLIVGVCLGALYLVFFRDLVGKSKA